MSKVWTTRTVATTTRTKCQPILLLLLPRIARSASWTARPHRRIATQWSGCVRSAANRAKMSKPSKNEQSQQLRQFKVLEVELWQVQQQKQRAGLCNLKNTCFINALVQAIMSSASFTSCLGDPSTMAVNKSALTYLQLRRPSLWRHLSAITWLVLKWLTTSVTTAASGTQPRARRRLPLHLKTLWFSCCGLTAH